MTLWKKKTLAKWVRFNGVAWFAVGLLFNVASAQVDTWFRGAGDAFAAGRFGESAEQYRKAVTHFEQTGQDASLAVSLYNLSTVYHAMGQFKQAFDTLDKLMALTPQLNNPVLQRKAEALLATVAAFSRKSDLAREHFESALTSAEEADDRPMIAAIANDYGPFLAETGEEERGRELIDQSIDISRNSGNRDLLAKALLNRALVDLNKGVAFREEARIYGDAEVAAKVPAALNSAHGALTEAVEETVKLAESHSKALLLNSAGDAWREIRDAGGKPRAELTKRAFEAHHAALQTARKTGNHAAESFAIGSLALLYEGQNRNEEALELARAARQIAQEHTLTDRLYLYEWQAARLLEKQGQTDKSIAAYRRALETLSRIRHDVAISHGKRRLGNTFRDAVGPLFFEYAGLLLEKADDPGAAEAEIAEFLRQARDTVEQFKSAELEDYFQDDCVNLALEKVREIDDLEGHSAVFYLIPLEDRTEILVNIGGEISRFRADWNRERLRSAATQFRLALETRGSFSFITFAQDLYDAMIRPAEDLLKREKVETLVFVPDGALRTVPMGALHDGEEFLVEKWAVTVSPGLRLMDPQPVDWDRNQLLVGALTEAKEEFPALDYVDREIESIRTNLTAKVRKDSDFLKNPFVEEVRGGDIRLVHIASHGEFGDDAESSFVLTYDGRINLNELEQMIKPREFDGDPVELLALSACRTAAGDDRAALGLAGVALKSGARSALATLWYVNDAASATLVSAFYEELARNPDISKAEALRRAQKKLIEDLRYRHPCYWAAYLIIGNWL